MLLLYNPPSSANKKPILPMSLLALGALLEDSDVAYRIVDGNLLTDGEAELSRQIRRDEVRILALTVMPGPQLEHAVPLCRQLKALFPDLIIVWGGYFPTQHWQVVLRASYVDYVVRGHGECVFRDLLCRLDGGAELIDLKGLAFRDATSGEPTTTGMPVIPEPEELPDFPYHRVEMRRYARRTFMGERTMSHHSSYGCPFLCNFCAVVNMVKGGWLPQSAKRTAAATRRLVEEFGADSVEFFDNNFFVHQARTTEFCERIMDLGIQWWGEARIDTLLKYSDKSWQLMRRSGLRMVFLGAESGSDATLQRMDKGGTASVAKTLEIVAKMKRLGIVPELSFVLGNPPDPEADAAATLKLIRRLKKINPATEIIFYLYTPVPLSGELYDRAKASGFAFPDTLEGWVDPQWREFSQRRAEGLPWMRDPIHRRIRNFEKVLNAYYPTSTDIRLSGAWRWILKAAAGWRYHTRIYALPLELKVLQRLMTYQRPETAGF